MHSDHRKSLFRLSTIKFVSTCGQSEVWHAKVALKLLDIVVLFWQILGVLSLYCYYQLLQVVNNFIRTKITHTVLLKSAFVKSYYN